MENNKALQSLEIKEDGTLIFNGEIFVKKTEEQALIKKWEPKGGHYQIRGIGDIVNVRDSREMLRLYGAEFQTKRLAAEAIKTIRATQWLIHLVNEFNGDWRPNWLDGQQYKYVVYYSDLEGCFDTSPHYTYYPIGTPVFSEEAANIVCNMLNNGEIDKRVFIG